MKNLVRSRFFVLCLFVMPLFISTEAKAGPWYAACVTSCTVPLCAAATAAAGPLGANPGVWSAIFMKCASGCAIWIAACFASDTKVTVLENGHEVDRSIDSVRSGDIVRTLKNGKSAWTKAVKNTKSEGLFEFVQIEAVNSSNNVRKQLKVTPAHGMILVSHDGSRTLDAADHLVVGDRIIASNGDILTVSHLERVQLQDKYTLETEDGTILASDVFVSTICDEEVAGGERLLDPAMKDWHERHKFPNAN